MDPNPVEPVAAVRVGRHAPRGAMVRSASGADA